MIPWGAVQSPVYSNERCNAWSIDWNTMRESTGIECRPLTICLACSHGGHLTEMLQLLDAIEGHTCFYFCYDASTTRSLSDAYLVPNMARNPVEFVRNLGRLYTVFRLRKPDLVISTGAEIALPVLVIAMIFGAPMFYVECGAQVVSPSFTGRIMYWMANRFYVQWPELAKRYGPRAFYAGSLIDETMPETAPQQIQEHLLR